jgi:D-glycero-alpha-D-manno-heptose 1-phosphate guanylyltransferase
MHKDCIILAGGRGTRLQSVVKDQPKCLADINGEPFLHYILTQLKPHHFCKVVFSVGYLKDQVIDWVNNNWQRYGFAIDFAEETEPLGTGGGIKNALKYTDTDDVVVLNGDTMFNIDFDALLAINQMKQADVSLALKPMQNFDRYGTVVVNEENEIVKFEEKQFKENGLINGGIYCIYRPSFLSLDLPNVFSFEQDYLEKSASFKHHIYGLQQNNYFIDIGIPQDYEQAKLDFKTKF